MEDSSTEIPLRELPANNSNNPSANNSNNPSANNSNNPSSASPQASSSPSSQSSSSGPSAKSLTNAKTATLEKRSQYGQSFKVRFFALDEKKLWVYKKDSDAKPSSFINLEGCSVTVYSQDTSLLLIEHPERRTFVLKGPQNVIEEWQKALQEAAGTPEKKKRGSAIISEQSRVPLFQGHLTLADLGAWKSFNFYNYYFLLRKNIMFYFENETDLTTPLGWVLLSGCQIEEANYIPDARPFSFVISHPLRKPVLLNCDDQELLNAWINMIKGAFTAPAETTEERDARRANVMTLLNKKEAKKSGLLAGVTFLKALGQADYSGLIYTPKVSSIEWTQRYLVLKDNLLYILVTDKATEADMIMDLEDYTIEPAVAIGKKFVIDVYHPACISLTFCALDATDYDNWLKHLKRAIQKITESASQELMTAPRATRMIRSKGVDVELRGPRKPIFMGDLSLRTSPKAVDRKFFTLRRNILFYFKSKHAAAFDPIGVIPLDNCWVERINDLEFTVRHKSRREVRLVADTKHQVDDWMETIEQACAIDISEEGKKNPLKDLAKRKEEALAGEQSKKGKKDPSFLSTLDNVKQHSFLIYRRRDNGNWQKVYCILKDNIFFINSKDQNDSWPFNAVEVEDYEVKVVSTVPLAVFTLSHPHSPSFTLSAETEALMNDWVTALNGAIQLVRDFSDNLKADAMLAEAAGKKRKRGERPPAEQQQQQQSTSQEQKKTTE
jgi:hypothetical protein